MCVMSWARPSPFRIASSFSFMMIKLWRLQVFPSLAIPEWGKVLKALAERKPSAILIDKLFDFGIAEDEVAPFLEALRENEVPVFAGAFFTSTPIAGRDFLAAPNALASDSAPAELLESSEFPAGTAYGADERIRAAFSGFGHLTGMNQARVPLFFKDQRGRFFPHIGLAPALIGSDGHALLINGKRVDVEEAADMPVSLLSPQVIAGRAQSMKPVISRVRKGKDIPIVDEGDVVVILPAYFTGHSDWTDSPRGMIPGGHVVVSVANSALTGNWIGRWGSDWMFVLATTLVLLLGMSFFKGSPGSLLAASLAAAALSVVCGISLFVLTDLVVPWEVAFGSILLQGSLLVGYTLCLHQIEEMRRSADLELEQMVQKSFFPEIVSSDLFRISVHFQPAENVSGDWYFTKYHREKNVLDVMLADITGHGPASALVTGVLTGAVLARYESGEEGLSDLRECLTAVHAAVYRTGRKVNRVLTLSIWRIHLLSGRLEYINAGHPASVRIGKKVSCLVSRGDLVGSSEKHLFEIKEFQLEPNEILFTYTDGLIENESKEGKRFSKRELMRTLDGRPDPLAVTDSCLRKMSDLKLGSQDDVCFIAVQWLGSGQMNLVSVS